jgi:hypothetical protein
MWDFLLARTYIGLLKTESLPVLLLCSNLLDLMSCSLSISLLGQILPFFQLLLLRFENYLSYFMSDRQRDFSILHIFRGDLR